jgi:hypothetical protein
MEMRWKCIKDTGDSWRLVEIQWRYVRNPNAKAQVTSKDWRLEAVGNGAEG